MEQHKKYLENQCRVCGVKCKGYTHNKNSEQCKTALLSAFGIDVGEESETVYPPLVCHTCYLTLRQLQNAKETEMFRETKLVPQTWSPHNNQCQVCQDAGVAPRGRPKKRKAKGRPSEDDIHYHNRKLMHHLGTLKTPTYARSTIPTSQFLSTPYLPDLSCQICKSIPIQPIQLLSCHHFLCLSCIQTQSKNDSEISCPCNNKVLSVADVDSPSKLSLKILGGLLVQCDRGCGQVVELENFMQHVDSGCTNVPVPLPSKITVEQLLELELPSNLLTQTMGLVVDKLIPAHGPVTLLSFWKGMYYNNHQHNNNNLLTSRFHLSGLHHLG